MALTPDIDMSVEFLVDFHREGPWLLTAIANDDDGGRDRLVSKTFRPGAVQAMRDWIADRNSEDGMNIYFSVAEVREDMNKKATRADVERMTHCHVDIDQDYEKGESVEACQKRSLQNLHDKKDGIPKPTFIVNSGGGIQAYWKLKTPIEIGGDIIKCEEAKRHNQSLEMVFGGDSCHNVDRIMRLPGTVNWPDRRKRKKGRKPALAIMLEYNPKAVYAKEKIPPLEPVQESMGSSGFQTNTNIVISGNVERTKNLDALDVYGVNDRTKVIIIHGRHPNEPKEKDNSRSAWLFDCLCQLARAKVPDDVVYGIVTDSDWQISESVLDKKNKDTYIKRQMQRAKEWVIDPFLEEMNRKHAVIENFHGKPVVVDIRSDSLSASSILEHQTFSGFRDVYCNRSILVTDANDKTKKEPLGRWWLNHPDRRTYRRVIYAPNQVVGDTYNMWRGFACDPKPGNCDLINDHILHNICRGIEEHREYAVNWMARAVQEPGNPGEVAVVLRGGRGTGKTFLAEQFSALFGCHALTISDQKHLVGNFNAHLQCISVLFADEAFWAGSKKHEGTLKNLITGSTLAIERKGFDVRKVPNCVHLIMASNEQWVVPAGTDERRFFVLEVGEEQKQNAKYFGAIQEQMDNGGREAFLHFLLNRDIKRFDVRQAPSTLALQEQKLLTLSPLEGWLLRKLENGGMFSGDLEWREAVVVENLVHDYISDVSRFERTLRGSQTQVGMFLGKIFRNESGKSELQRAERTEPVLRAFDNGSSVNQSQRRMYYVLPDLNRCRELWELNVGPYEWPTPIILRDSDSEERHF